MKDTFLSLLDRFINYKKNLSGGKLVGVGATLLTGGTVAKLLVQSDIVGEFHTPYGNITVNLTAGGIEWYAIAMGVILIVSGIYLHLKKATTSKLTPLEIQSLPKADASHLRSHLIENSRGSVGDGHFSDLRGSFIAESLDIDDWREAITEKLRSVREFLEQSGRSNPDMKLAIGAIAHVPLLAAIGYYLTNRTNAIFYCWNRDKRTWINTEDHTDGGKRFHIECVKSSGNAQQVGIILQCSIPVNTEEFLKQTNCEACYLVSLDRVGLGNLFSAYEQQRLCREFREFYNQTIRPQHPQINRLDVTISAQASFVMRLGAEFNQNHMPEEIRVWHFENQKYPWSLSIFPHRRRNPINIEWNTSEATVA
jgi:hypothetical protein